MHATTQPRIERPLRHRWAARLALCLALAATGCAQADGGAAKSAGAAKAPGQQDPMARIHALIGDAACRSDADCRTLGVGERACGGPAQFLAFSTQRSDAGALARAAEAQRQAQRRADAAKPEGERMMSTCQVLPDPGAVCVRPAGAAASGPGRCQLRGAPAGAGGPVVR